MLGLIDLDDVSVVVDGFWSGKLKHKRNINKYMRWRTGLDGLVPTEIAGYVLLCLWTQIHRQTLRAKHCNISYFIYLLLFFT